MADPYTRQLALRDATATLPFARPEAYGAGLVDAVAQGASAVSREMAVRTAEEKQLERDKQATAAALMFAKIQEDAVTFATEQQGQTDPGGAGYTRQVEAFLQDREAQFLGSIGDEKVREVMAARFAEWRSKSIIAAQGWEKGQSVALAVSNYGEVTKIRANQAGRVDAAGFVQLLEEQGQDLALLEGIAPDVRVKLDRAGTEEIAVGWLIGRTPQEQKELLASGRFDMLDPNVVRQLNANADIEIAREAKEAEARQKIIQAEVADTIDQVLADVGDGLPVTDKQLAEVQAAAEQLGMKDRVTDIFDARIRNNANREFQNVGVVAIDTEVKRLNTRIAQAGDKATRADIVRRDHLADLRDKRRQMIDGDPAEFASRLGVEWKPLQVDSLESLNASVAERKKAARATSAAAGIPVKFLTEAEADQFAANLGTTQGRTALLDLASAFGADGGKVIDQVAPDQPLLKHLTGLSPKQRGIALEGAGLISGKGYKPPEGLDDAIRARIGTAMNGFNEAARTGVIETTRGFYAYYKARAGDDGAEVDQRLLTLAVDRALGSVDTKPGEEGGRDGLATWRGTMRFVLPTRMTEAEFRRRISGEKLDGFFWSDGRTPVTAKQLRERFVPEKISGTRYRWRQIGGAGGYALNRAGEPAVLDIGKLKDPGVPARDYYERLRGTEALSQMGM